VIKTTANRTANTDNQLQHTSTIKWYKKSDRKECTDTIRDRRSYLKSGKVETSTRLVK